MIARKTELKEVVIGDYIQVIRRQHKIKKADYLPSGDIPVIDQGSEFISGYINDKDKVYNGPLPIIVFGDHTCVYKYVDFPFAVGADGTQLLHPSKEFDPRYFYYCLCTVPLEQFGYQRHFKYLKKYKIYWRPMPIQQKIASILSSYDDLIENNTRRIQILEEMAQRIYQEWFVNFRFPGHEKVRFVNSELGKIPEGWEVVQLGEVLESIESGSRPKGGIDSSEREVPSIGAENVLGLGRYDFNKEKYVSREFYENMRKGKVQSGDVLLYKDGAKIGRKSMFRDGFPHEVCCINEHVFILRTNSRCSQNYLYFYLDRPDITQKIINLNTNAAQPGINQAGVKSLPILLPPKELIELFDNKVEPLLGLLFNLAKKNQTLRKKRDLLLPKLISGEIDVSNWEVVGSRW